MIRLLALVIMVLLSGCAAAVTVVESPWKAAPMWTADQHRRMAARFESWMAAAGPVADAREVAKQLKLPGVVIIGESHDGPDQAKALVRAVMKRGPAELWEEAIIWRLTPGEPRLQGLYSREWQGEESSGRRVLAGGDRFNTVFASAIGNNPPPSLVVYAGNAHAIHEPEIDGPEPRSGGPLPADAARDAGLTVSAVAVYSRSHLINHLDLNMTVAILAAFSRGELDLQRARQEIEWSIGVLDAAAKEVSKRGNLLIESSPGRFIAVMGDGGSPWSMRTVQAAGRFLSDEQVGPVLNDGAGVELVQRAFSNGVMGRALEEFVFAVRPRGGPVREFVVTPRGALPKPRRSSSQRRRAILRPLGVCLC